MKNFLLVLGGFVLGVILTLVVLFGIYIFKSPNGQISPDNETITEMDGVKMFGEPGEIIEEKSFRVFQVIANNGALVHGKDHYLSSENDNLYYGAVYLLINNDKKYYYDDEIVKVPTGKVVRQVGICQYPTRDDKYKTVPIVEILDE